MGEKRRKRKSIFCRFCSYISKDTKTGCWLWTASKDQNGYGKLPTERGKSPARAHRLSYSFFKGPILPKMYILHECDNPSCVNPDHLTMGTQADNMRAASKRNRLNSKSFLNLRPGAKGHNGAGPKSNKEIKLCQA